ncbi:MAG: T9SS type A sorting domain-containing protein [Paludibacteraceae bacterium]|nr:T9SS type A sorting domain-containing protein [Paludibacteraceae bacterium]
MKKILTIISICFALLCTTTASAADYLTKETSLTTPIYPSDEATTSFFYTVSSTGTSPNINTKIKIYNSDYSVYKESTLAIPSTKSIDQGDYNTDLFLNPYGVFATKHLFNSDDKIEFLVLSWCMMCSSTYSLQLYDEDGTLLQDFGVKRYAKIIQTTDSKLKLIIGLNSTDSVTSIYTLPGTLSSVSLKSATVSDSPYPNPASTTVTLPYSIASGTTTTMSIYNTKGLLIEQKTIDSVFDKILLNVSGYEPGTYIYTYNGISNRFIVK